MSWVPGEEGAEWKCQAGGVLALHLGSQAGRAVEGASFGSWPLPTQDDPGKGGKMLVTISTLSNSEHRREAQTRQCVKELLGPIKMH